MCILETLCSSYIVNLQWFAKLGKPYQNNYIQYIDTPNLTHDEKNNLEFMRLGIRVKKGFKFVI